MAYTTLGTEKRRVFFIEESYAIVMGFPIGTSGIPAVKATLHKGQTVTLTSTGTVLPAASTDFPIGTVVSTYEGNDDNNVRVATPFVNVVRAKVGSNINAGVLVAYDSWDSTNDVPVYKAAGVGDYVSGVVVTGGLANSTEIRVGILRVPSLVAIPSP